MKTKLLSLLFFSYITFATKAQTSDWLWARGAGRNGGNSQGSSIIADASGNSIVTGFFECSSIDFGAATLTNDNTDPNSRNVFMTKYDPSGNVLWAKNFGGLTLINIGGTCTDASGNIFITGSFSSPTLALGIYTLTNYGGGDLFMAKLDASGNALWAKSAGGNLGEAGESISTDASGNIFTTGSFFSPTLALGNNTLTNPNTTDAKYLAKCDASGNVLWAKGIAGNYYYSGLHIAADANGNSFLTGSFGPGTLNFGNNISVTNTINASGNYEVFVAKFDASGNAVWAKSSSDRAYALSTGISVDHGGNVFVTGWFLTDSLTFGGTTLINSGYSPASVTEDVFIVKYDASGNVLWARSAGGTLIDQAYGIATDASGNAYVAGYFASLSLAFGGVTIYNSNGQGVIPDAFVAKYDASGNILKAENFGGIFADGAMGVCTDPSGDLYMTGSFSSWNISFGYDTLTNSSSNNIGIPYSYVFTTKGSGTLTGLKENSLNAMKIFPNPFSTQMTLQTEQPFENATLMLDNCMGQTVKQLQNVSGQSISVSRDNLPAGLYLLRVSEGDKLLFTKKIIVSD